MRTRLTVAVLVLMAVTLTVTSLVSDLLVHRAVVTSAQQEITSQGRAIATTVADSQSTTRLAYRRDLAILRDGLFTQVAVVRVLPGGGVVGAPPAGLPASALDLPAVEQGTQISGHTAGLLVFTAVRLPILTSSGSVPATTYVLVLTRKVEDPTGGFRVFGLVAAAGLAVSAVVAALLARRFSRPLVDAVSTTRRIASGDLDATMPDRPGLDREFVALAAAIDSMAGDLRRARDQERQFLLSVSHELRTPLTSIQGYADAVLDGAVDDPVAAARVISGEAGRLDRLVRDLLDLARLDADRFTFHLQTVDAALVIRQVCDGLGHAVAGAGLTLVTPPSPDRPLWVWADPDRLAQVVANLVENATSFARTTVAVGWTDVDGPPRLWVDDDGPGIPAEELSRVFERHYVSDRSSGRRVGTGLGLAIVAELSTAMGARPEAVSPVTGSPAVGAGVPGEGGSGQAAGGVPGASRAGGGTRMVVHLTAGAPPGAAAGVPPGAGAPVPAGAAPGTPPRDPVVPSDADGPTR